MKDYIRSSEKKKNVNNDDSDDSSDNSSDDESDEDKNRNKKSATKEKGKTKEKNKKKKKQGDSKKSDKNDVSKYENAQVGNLEDLLSTDELVSFSQSAKDYRQAQNNAFMINKPDGSNVSQKSRYGKKNTSNINNNKNKNNEEKSSGNDIFDLFGNSSPNQPLSPQNQTTDSKGNGGHVFDFGNDDPFSNVESKEKENGKKENNNLFSDADDWIASLNINAPAAVSKDQLHWSSKSNADINTDSLFDTHMASASNNNNMNNNNSNISGIQSNNQSKTNNNDWWNMGNGNSAPQESAKKKQLTNKSPQMDLGNDPFAGLGAPNSSNNNNNNDFGWSSSQQAKGSSKASPYQQRNQKNGDAFQGLVNFN